MWRGVAAFVFGRPVERQLPERVRLAIARQQAQAEVLIGWTQLALVLLLLAVYTVSPKTSDGTPFHPVPWVLGAFALVTVVRIALARRRLIAGWFLGGSVLIDVALLMLLIWSFHIQYMQPAAFYLKSPTLLYVFLLIALRALRYEAAYVVVAGLGAAAGWAVLVGYALTEPGGGVSVTRDYVEYLTANRILIGAEVDKILCILVVTAVLAVALVRARRLLMQAVTDATVARDLTRFVAPEVASRITAADRAIEPGDGEVVTASVLFTDIEGFSTIAETLAPDRLMRVLNEYFADVAEIVDRHGGVITGYQGDAILIGFNTARPNPEHAACALRTALEIQTLVASRRFGDGLILKTRCGVNTGPMLTGAVGTRERLLFTVYGDEVNIAARLEQLNKTYGTYVLATEQTLAAAGGGFSTRPMGSVPVRGRSRAVDICAIFATLPEPRAPLGTPPAQTTMSR